MWNEMKLAAQIRIAGGRGAEKWRSQVECPYVQVSYG
jgi:hypothetical protein